MKLELNKDELMLLRVLLSKDLAWHKKHKTGKEEIASSIFCKLNDLNKEVKAPAHDEYSGESRNI